MVTNKFAREMKDFISTIKGAWEYYVYMLIALFAILKYYAYILIALFMVLAVFTAGHDIWLAFIR